MSQQHVTTTVSSREIAFMWAVVLSMAVSGVLTAWIPFWIAGAFGIVALIRRRDIFKVMFKDTARCATSFFKRGQ